MTPLLTLRQREVFGFIEAFRAANQKPPTRVEISNHFGWRSPNAAEEHLQAIARKGHITLRPGESRGIVVNVNLDFGELQAVWPSIVQAA